MENNHCKAVLFTKNGIYNGFEHLHLLVKTEGLRYSAP